MHWERRGVHFFDGVNDFVEEMSRRDDGSSRCFESLALFVAGARSKLSRTARCNGGMSDCCPSLRGCSRETLDGEETSSTSAPAPSKTEGALRSSVERHAGSSDVVRDTSTSVGSPQQVVKSMTYNPSFPSPSPTLAAITTATAELQTAENAALAQT
jgi:hypothetical protein